MTGKVVSKGIAIGRVKRIEPYRPVGLVKTQEKDEALKVLWQSHTETSQQLKDLAKKTLETIGEHEAQIFEAHLMILEDPTLYPQIEALVQNDNLTAASAIEQALTAMEEMFKSLDSDYMKERALDVYDIKKRWVSNVLNPVVSDVVSDQPVILVAEELTPSDTLEMDLSKVAGLLMEKGGVTSHTAILAQSLDIPAMVGCGHLDHLPQDHLLILDANDGLILDDFDQKTLNDYEAIKIKEVQEKHALQLYKDKIGMTPYGKRVEIAANIAGPQDIEALHACGAEGVGLFRTEFIYMNRSAPPTEGEQYEVYREILQALDGKPIIFRTMDIGGDKEVPYLNMPVEPNPFLGYRAVRYCLNQVAFFKTQIRAILKASILGPIKIMFPMIGSTQQFLDAKAIVMECIAELEGEGFTIGHVPIGIMVEIPSAAILAEQFAKHVDFFSIGTNDLTQYTLAVDRQNESVGDLYDYFDPAVLNLIHHVITVGKKTNTWVGMCGSAAGDENMIPLLVSWGIDEISMSTSQVLTAKKVVCNLDQDHYDLEKMFSMTDAKQVRKNLFS